MSELRGRSTSDPALQRYVIAWAEQDHARAVLSAATQALHRETPAARQALSRAGAVVAGNGGTVTPIVVELLDGKSFDVFADTAGIVVLPRADEARS